jgi:hypothetical protein
MGQVKLKAVAALQQLCDGPLPRDFDVGLRRAHAEAQHVPRRRAQLEGRRQLCVVLVEGVGGGRVSVSVCREIH